MSEFDIVIKNGTIIDGRRTPRFKGDIGIKDGLVAAITGANGLSPQRGAEVIDAEGLIVAPGFVDLHTHFDAQIFWDPYCTIGGWHGVTSVVIGDCGFGLAPCRPEMRERAMPTTNRAV
ncbi:MAG TPA: amidohydrolase family protein, partial [Porticoccaceae bacterium]